MSDRTRLLSLMYPANKEPVYVEDAGNKLLIAGVLMQGMGANFLLLLPQACNVGPLDVVQPTLEEWSEILRRSDDPLVFEQDETGTIKAIHRKQEAAISGAIQQQVWARDGFRCLYCGDKMGKVQLTVDHFTPLELGGERALQNYVSCCRRCNKLKGSRDPKEFCDAEFLDHGGLAAYLEGKAPISFIFHIK